MIYDFAHILCSHLQTERHGWRLDWWCSCEWTWVYSVIATKWWFTRQPSDTKRIWNVVVLGLKVKVWFYIAFYLVVPTQFIIPIILVDCCVWGWFGLCSRRLDVQIFICCHTVHDVDLNKYITTIKTATTLQGWTYPTIHLRKRQTKQVLEGFVPTYAILSHNWGPQDVLHQTSPSRCTKHLGVLLAPWGSQTYNKTTAFVNHTQLGSSGCLYIPNFTQRSSWGNAIYPSSYMVAYLFR